MVKICSDTLQQVKKLKYFGIVCKWQNKEIHTQFSKANTTLHELYCFVVTECELLYIIKRTIFNFILILTNGDKF